MGDHGVDQLGVRLHQRERTDGAAAGAEHHGRARVEVHQEPGEVVGAHLRGRIAIPVVDRAAVDAPRVRREHGVVGREQIRRRREGVGVHGGADEHHDGTRAPHLVVQPGTGDVEDPGVGGGGRCGIHRFSSFEVVILGRR